MGNPYATNMGMPSYGMGSMTSYGTNQGMGMSNALVPYGFGAMPSMINPNSTNADGGIYVGPILDNTEYGAPPKVESEP